MDKMMPGKGGLAVMIAMKAAKKHGDENKGPDMLTESAQEILDAIESGDAKSFGKLLKDFVMACCNDGEYNTEKSNDEEDGEGY